MTTPPYRVLLIEDNTEDAALFAQLLGLVSGGDFVIEHADHLAAGLTRLAQSGIDAVLLDLRLPDSDGLATLDRTLAAAPTVPILVLTGLDDNCIGLEAIHKGAQDFIIKGKITGAGMARALRYGIERQRAEEARQRQDVEIRILSEQLPALLWTTDHQLRITSSLGAGLAELNLRPGAVVGKTLFEYVGTADESHPIIAMHRQALSGETVITELDWQGRRYHSRLEPFLGRNNQVIGIIGVALDVTEQIQTKEDFRAAAEIQKRLLPKSAPCLPGWDIAGFCQPAAATGGDFFDYIRMQDGSLGIVVADVSKHGFAPALIMCSTRRSLRNISGLHSDLATILSVANRALIEDTGSEYFVTLFFAKLDPQARSLTYAGAGHEGYLFSPQGEITRLKSTAFPLGVAEDDIAANPDPLPLKAGHLLLLLTDGLQEAMKGGEGELFGLEKIKQLVLGHRARPAKEIVDILVQAVRDYCLPRAPHDDLTVVVLKLVD